MQRQKNIRQLLLLIVLVATVTLLFLFSNTATHEAVDKTIFQIPQLEQVDQLWLESPKGKTTLRFDGANWKVDDRFEADRQMMKVLFATLKQTAVKRPVAAHQKDSLQKEIKGKGVKVTAWTGTSRAKEFWVGGNREKNETYFMGQDGQPFVVSIPGYRVTVAAIFELPPIEWRNKQVFRFNWQNIKTLQVTFPGDARQSFQAGFQGNFFGIDGIATDTTKLDQFMDALLQLRADKLLDESQASAYDSLKRTRALVEVVIADVAQRKYTLTVFPAWHRQVVATSQDGWFILNPLDLSRLYRKKDYFIAR